MSPRVFRLVLFVATASSLIAQGVSPFASSVWCGNVTPTSASVVARLTSAGVKARLQVSTAASLASPVFSAAANTAATAGNTLTLSVQGLQPDTDYYYGIEVAGVLRAETASRGRFHTFPQGRASFRIAFASCSDFNAADQSAFDAIAPVAFHPHR